MDKSFSEETKNVIAESRRIALSLGNDYISTIHFLLADCKLNDRYSIRNFAFKTEEDLQNFMNELKNGEPEKDLDRFLSPLRLSKLLTMLSCFGITIPTAMIKFILIIYFLRQAD